MESNDSTEIPDRGEKTDARKSLLKFTSSPFVASSGPRIRTHTHTLEVCTADNRRTLRSKLIITPWRPQRVSSTGREGTSLSRRETSLSITKHHTTKRNTLSF